MKAPPQAVLILLAVALALLTSRRARADTFDSRCAAAHAIGAGEGKAIYASVIAGLDACALLKTDPFFIWKEAHTARVYLWNIAAFAPVTGLEDAQECRQVGQNAALDKEHATIVEACRLATPNAGRLNQ